MKILVAEIVTTHGIKGNLKIKSLTNNEDRFNPGSKLYLDDKEVIIEKSFMHKGNYVIKFLGYDDINQVDKFIGHELTINKEDLLDLEENEFYLFDLEGLEVFENGEKKGFIKEIITGVYPNDVYVVETESGEVLLPALNATIVKIDIENKKIEVKNFEDYE